MSHRHPEWFGAGRARRSLFAALLLAFAMAGPSAAAATEDAHARHGAAAAQQLPAIDPHAQHKQAAAAEASSTEARVDLPPGVPLLNQHGDTVDLLADVIGDRIAVVNFAYTNCTTVCPVTSAIFAMVQQRMAERMGREVVLVTITVDPLRDTPQRLKSFSGSFNPGPSWSWLTGRKRDVDRVLDAFGAYTVSFEDHPAMVLIGDQRQGSWYRLYGFPAPEAIESRVTELLGKRSS